MTVARMSSEDQPLASLSLTHVHYDPRDFISYLCAWLALLPQGLCIVYATLIYATREIEIVLTFGGQLSCEAVNWLLKRWIKEARPQTIHVLGKGYGMPSSHSQFVAFFAVYVSLFLYFRHSPAFAALAARSQRQGQKANGQAAAGGPESDAEDEHHPQSSISPVYALQLQNPRLTHTVLAAGIFMVCALVAASRIYLAYHTPKQVYVGLSVGATYAVIWFGITEWARRTGWVEWLLEWDIVRKMRIRDLLCEEDLVEIGWQAWEDKRRRRRIGKGKRVRLVEPPKESKGKKGR